MFGRGKKPIDKPAADPPNAAERSGARGAHRGGRTLGRGGRSARRRTGAARAAQRGARSDVQGHSGQRRFVRPRHQQRRRAAAVDRRGRACRDGPRQAAIPFRAGHPLRPRGDRRNPTRFPTWSRRSPATWRAGWSSASARWPTMPGPARRPPTRVRLERSRGRWGLFWTFVFGFIGGAAALFVLALLSQPHP